MGQSTLTKRSTVTLSRLSGLTGRSVRSLASCARKEIEADRTSSAHSCGLTERLSIGAEECSWILTQNRDVVPPAEPKHCSPSKKRSPQNANQILDTLLRCSETSIVPMVC